MKMAAKVKKEAPAPTKTEAKAKVLKAKDAVLKSVHSHTHTRNDPSVIHLPMPKTLWPQRQPKYLRKSFHRRNKLDHCAIIKFPDTVFIVDVKANKHKIKQAVKTLCDIEVAKVNTLIRPDGEKKA
ncbi:large ribosomal subunit protein uL23-like [Saccopteryx leptura]|uniref:large ribosomal subunit protein uL23-like n=1 Tax=Saccopteryx leptura TaxID=249018 RepID=UPI00339D210E